MKKRSWTKEQLITAIAKSYSYRQVLIRINLQPAGGNYEQLKHYIKEYNCNTKHFKGKAWNKGLKGTGKPLKTLESILVKNSNYQSYKLKNRLFTEKLKYPECEECGWAKRTHDGYLPLELDHINGDRRDNRIKNLRILCPNCHSLKPTHRGKNKRKKRVL